MEQITTQEFSTRLHNAGDIEAFKDLSLTFDFSISQDNCKSKRLTFENCTFSKTFEICKIDLNLGVAFKDCTFNEYLIIQGVTISEQFMDQRIDHRNNSLLLENCKFDKVLSINSNQFLRDTKIDKSTIHELLISNLTSTEGGFILRKCTIEYYVTMEQCRFMDSIRFHEVICQDSLRFTNNTASSYSFNDNTFNSDSWIWYGKLKEGINIQDGTYQKAFIVESVDAKGYLTISGAKFKSSVSIAYECKNGGKLYRYGCPKIYLRDSEFDYGLFINGKRFSEDNYPIEIIDIHLSQLMKGEINIDGCNIADLTIKGANYNCTLVLNNNQFTNITFNRLTNLSNIHLLNSRANLDGDKSNAFKSINSYMGRTHFTNFSFEGFKNIELDDSNYSEIMTVNVRWFDPKRILQKSKNCKDYEKNRDLFRQLKYAMFKQGDRVQALFLKDMRCKLLENNYL